jgi:hypothetical protein
LICFENKPSTAFCRYQESFFFFFTDFFKLESNSKITVPGSNVTESVLKVYANIPILIKFSKNNGENLPVSKAKQ